MSEWSKEHAWKVCIPQKGIKGSNPFSSAVGPNELPERHLVGRTSDGGIYSDGQGVRQAKKLLVFVRDKCREPAGRQGKNKPRSGAVNPVESCLRREAGERPKNSSRSGAVALSKTKKNFRDPVSGIAVQNQHETTQTKNN